MSEEKDYTKNLKLRGPTVKASTTVIQRGSSGSVPGFTSQRSSILRQSVSPMYSHGTLSGMSHKGVTEVITGRETEKKQMQGLNERFASYIEKVRFLEAQNKCCMNEIERLKKQKGFDATEIKELYQQELDGCRKIIDDLSSQKAKFDSALVGLQDALDDERRERIEAENESKELRAKLDRLNDQIGEYEGEITTLRGRINNLEDELGKVKAANKRLQEDCSRLRADLDRETCKRIEAEREAQTIMEDLTFRLNAAEAEIKELRSLLDRDKTVEIRNFWKGEIQNTINALQKEYDSQLQEMRISNEMKMENQLRDLQAGVNRDNMENAQLREECKRLKSKIGDANPRLAELESQCDSLRRQLALLREEYDDYRSGCESELAKKDLDLQKVLEENEDILKELQFLQDAKLSMEMEICTYRKLLEGEEQSLNSTIQSISGSRSKEADKLADIIQQSSSGGFQSSYGGGSGQFSGSGGGLQYENVEDMQEATGRATVTKSHRGAIAFAQAHNKGLFVELENVDKTKSVDLKGWSVVKLVNSSEKCRFLFTTNCMVNPGENVILRTRKASDSDIPASDRSRRFLCEFNTWFGGGGKYTLRDNNGDDRASMEIKVT